MGGFQIELDRTFVTHEGDPHEVWIASVDAEAYRDVVGKTPGEALHALEREFDDQFGHEARGWNDGAELEEVLDIDEIV